MTRESRRQRASGASSGTVRAENPAHSSDQQSCSPGRPGVMITDHVPAVRVRHVALLFRMEWIASKRQGVARPAGHARDHRGPLLGEEQPGGGDQHHRLGGLDRQDRGERPPPPPRDSLGLRQRVAGQRERRDGDQHHGQHQPRHVDHRQHQHQRDREQGQQDEEHPARSQHPLDQAAQHRTCGGGVQPLPGESGRQPVGDRDRLAGQQQREVGARRLQRGATGQRTAGYRPANRISGSPASDT